MPEFIPINIPLLGEKEKRAALSVLESGRLTDASYEGGKFVRDLESKIARRVGAKHAVAVNSGTAALHTSLMAYGIGHGDEVIVPAFTFEATANVVLACGAKPVFADIREDYNIDPSDVRRKMTKRTKAIIPVDVYGYPSDLDEVREIADKASAKVIEDAAESLGAEYRGRQTGKTDHAGCFSLYATKVATSGEGGAVTTDDDDFADKVRMTRNHGMRQGYDTSVLGLNYRLPEISAAIASVQLERLDEFIEARRRNAKIIIESAVSRLEKRGVRLTQRSPEKKHIWYLFTLTLADDRDKVLARLRAKGIGAAVYWQTAVNRMPLYESLGYGTVKLPGCYHAAAHVISLPVHPGVGEHDAERIAAEFSQAVAP